MNTSAQTTITIGTSINAPIAKVWECWTDPKHICQWNNASEDWHTPRAENDLKVGGRFVSRMEAKDGSAGFDFGGVYMKVIPLERIDYTLDDGRRVEIEFSSEGSTTNIRESFVAENQYSLEEQTSGWQAIMDNFKSYVESNPKLERLHFEILIHAPKEKVYWTMIEDQAYREWTSVFCVGSHFRGSWEKGSKIHFLGPDNNGQMGGMVSVIKENIPNEYISIEHQGLIHNDQEIMSGKEVEVWAGALENYRFIKNYGKTLVRVETDITSEFVPHMQESWPKALEKLKEICEK